MQLHLSESASCCFKNSYGVTLDLMGAIATLLNLVVHICLKPLAGIFRGFFDEEYFRRPNKDSARLLMERIVKFGFFVSQRHRIAMVGNFQKLSCWKTHECSKRREYQGFLSKVSVANCFISVPRTWI